MSWIRAKCNYVFCEANKNNNFSVVFIVPRAYSKPERKQQKYKSGTHSLVFCAQWFCLMCGRDFSILSQYRRRVLLPFLIFIRDNLTQTCNLICAAVCVQVPGCELHRAEVTRFPPGRLRTYSSNLELQKDALAACMGKNNALKWNNNKRKHTFPLAGKALLVASSFYYSTLFATYHQLKSFAIFFSAFAFSFFSRGFIFDSILADTSKMSSNKLFIE